MNVMISTCESFRADAEARLSPQRPASILFTDEAAFCDWIAHAAPGTRTVYFRGHLAYDRMPSSNTFREPERKRLVAVARRAIQAAEDGLVHLVQRRHGPGDYSYLAIKALVGRPGRFIPGGATAGR